VLDVYTQAKQIYLSLSGIIKLVYNCRIQWKLNVGVALSAQFLAYTDQFKQTKTLQEDELHIYDAYRAHLQTQEEFTLE
jgi:hypothetical protein